MGEEVLDPDDTFPGEYDYSNPYLCRHCGGMLLPENKRVADGCPCNSPRGVNHGLVAKNTCTCVVCDPDQTGSTRIGRRRPVGGAKLTEEELADIRDRRRFKPGVDLGIYIDKLLAHVDALRDENDLLREERAQRPTLKSFNELTEQLQSVREDVTRVQVATLRTDNDELRAVAAELLDALPKCDTKGCDAQAIYLDEDGPVYCGEHASVVDPGDELELADPAARLRALLGKAGA